MSAHPDALEKSLIDVVPIMTYQILIDGITILHTNQELLGHLVHGIPAIFTTFSTQCWLITSPIC